MRRGLGLVLLLLVGATAGCMLGPDYLRPEVSSPGEFRHQTPTAESLANLDWWSVFEDPALQELIGVAWGWRIDHRSVPAGR